MDVRIGIEVERFSDGTGFTFTYEGIRSTRAYVRVDVRRFEIELNLLSMRREIFFSSR
jgi:hypothetical protein